MIQYLFIFSFIILKCCIPIFTKIHQFDGLIYINYCEITKMK